MNRPRSRREKQGAEKHSQKYPFQQYLNKLRPCAGYNYTSSRANIIMNGRADRRPESRTILSVARYRGSSSRIDNGEDRRVDANG